MVITTEMASHVRTFWRYSVYSVILDGDSFKYIKSIQRGGNHGTRYLPMPVYLFDVLLTLMHEQKLIGNVDVLIGNVALLLGVLLHTKIPKGDLVICTTGSQDAVFSRVPLD